MAGFAGGCKGSPECTLGTAVSRFSLPEADTKHPTGIQKQASNLHPFGPSVCIRSILMASSPQDLRVFSGASDHPAEQKRKRLPRALLACENCRSRKLRVCLPGPRYAFPDLDPNPQPQPQLRPQPPHPNPNPDLNLNLHLDLFGCSFTKSLLMSLR